MFAEMTPDVKLKSINFSEHENVPVLGSVKVGLSNGS